MYKKNSDYGIIGNSRTLALVGNDGSIDWLCLPFMDSASVFAALLDGHQGGRFSVQPAADWDSVAAYLPGTNILETRFRTRHGIMKLIDFMPVFRNESRDADPKPSEIYRCLEAMQGELTVEAVFDPRFDYARETTSLEAKEGALVAKGVNETLVLSASHGCWTIQHTQPRETLRRKRNQTPRSCVLYFEGVFPDRFYRAHPILIKTRLSSCTH